MPKQQMNIPKAVLQKLYWKDGMSLRQISEKFKIPETTLFYRFQKFKIKRRDRCVVNTKINMTLKNKIINYYAKQNKSTTEIADEFNLCNGTVRNVLIRNNIARRSASVGRALSLKKNLISNIVKKSELIQLYKIQKLSLADTGKRLNISETTVFRLMKHFRIKSRSRSEGISLSFNNYPHKRKVMSENVKRNFKKIINSIQLKPNNPEKIVMGILNDKFPNQWKYVGDGALIINGHCPDFVNCNGKKQVILVNGIYWHSKRMKLTKTQAEDKESKSYIEVGFKPIFLWEDEIDFNYVVQKIKDGGVNGIDNRG